MRQWWTHCHAENIKILCFAARSIDMTLRMDISLPKQEIDRSLYHKIASRMKWHHDAESATQAIRLPSNCFRCYRSMGTFKIGNNHFLIRGSFIQHRFYFMCVADFLTSILIKLSSQVSAKNQRYAFHGESVFCSQSSTIP